jgi:hypothetical protein
VPADGEPGGRVRDERRFLRDLVLNGGRNEHAPRLVTVC